MILCMQCGHQNKNLNGFCTSCGSRLSDKHYEVARLVLLEQDVHTEYLVSEAERHVGRDVSNDIVLKDDQVSSLHMKIVYREGEYQVEDLDSTNGTYVNGERIEGPVTLKNDDLVKVGRTIFKFIV